MRGRERERVDVGMARARWLQKEDKAHYTKYMKLLTQQNLIHIEISLLTSGLPLPPRTQQI